MSYTELGTSAEHDATEWCGFCFSMVQFFALADAFVHQGAWVWPVGVTDMLGL